MPYLIPLTKGFVMAALLAALTDPQWAVTINTALLVLLAILNIRHSKEVKDARTEVRQAREEATDAARIARELGAVARSTETETKP